MGGAAGEKIAVFHCSSGLGYGGQCRGTLEQPSASILVSLY